MVARSSLEPNDVAHAHFRAPDKTSTISRNVLEYATNSGSDFVHLLAVSVWTGRSTDQRLVIIRCRPRVPPQVAVGNVIWPHAKCFAHRLDEPIDTARVATSVSCCVRLPAVLRNEIVVAPPSPIPLYHQVSTVLRARIVDGVYAEGDQIPTEELLTAEFNVSKATVRQAVAELVQSGLVQRKQGKGTFVLPSVVHRVRQRYSGSRSDLIGDTPGTRVREVTVDQDAPIPPRIARKLELDQPVGTIVRRTREIEGQVYCYTINFLPSSHGRVLSRSKLLRQQVTAILQANGVGLGRSTSWIRADVVDPELSQKLEVPFGTPALAVERLIQDLQGAPIEFVQAWYRSDIYQYTVEVDHQR